jgi:hypothetical protein
MLCSVDWVLLQLVWIGTTSIGCGVVTTCSTRLGATFIAVNMVVCDYYPAGNWIDANGGYSRFILNVKPAGGLARFGAHT